MHHLYIFILGKVLLLIISLCCLSFWLLLLLLLLNILDEIIFLSKNPIMALGNDLPIVQVWLFFYLSDFFRRVNGVWLDWGLDWEFDWSANFWVYALYYFDDFTKYYEIDCRIYGNVLRLPLGNRENMLSSNKSSKEISTQRPKFSWLLIVRYFFFSLSLVA